VTKLIKERELHFNTRRVGSLIRTVMSGEQVNPGDLKACTTLILTGEVRAPQLYLGALFSSLQAGIEKSNYGVDEVLAVVEAALALDDRKFDPASWTDESPFVGCTGAGKKAVSTANVSTAAAFIAASGGAKVLKVCSTGFTSPVGSLDLLDRLTVPSDPARGVELGRSLGLGFINVDQLAPRLNDQYGGRFTFPNPMSYLSSALLYPVPLRGILLGTPHSQTDISAAILAKSGARRGLVVCGWANDGYGLDEVSPYGFTRISELSGDSISTTVWSPERLGLERSYAGTELGPPIHTAEEGVNALVRALSGTAADDTLALATLNAGALLYLAEITQSIDAGYRLAVDLVSGGAAFAYYKDYLAAARGLGK
jgi:anthranilate phosphoribosyltransferase